MFTNTLSLSSWLTTLVRSMRRAINGTQESILLSIDDAGNLVFKEAQKLASEQTFSSYGWNRFSDSKPVMGAYRGIGEVYVQPKLTRK